MGVTYNQEQAAVRADLSALLETARSGVFSDNWDSGLQSAAALYAFARSWRHFAPEIEEVACIIQQDDASLETLSNRYESDEWSQDRTDPKDTVAVALMLLTWGWLSRRLRHRLRMSEVALNLLHQAELDMLESPGHSKAGATRVISACHKVFRAASYSDTFEACPDPLYTGWLSHKSWQDEGGPLF